MPSFESHQDSCQKTQRASDLRDRRHLAAPQGPAQKQTTEKHPVFLRKGPILSTLKRHLEGQASNTIHIQGPTEIHFKDYKGWGHHLRAAPRLAAGHQCLPGMSLYTVWHPDCCGCQPSITWLWWQAFRVLSTVWNPGRTMQVKCHGLHTTLTVETQPMERPRILVTAPIHLPSRLWPRGHTSGSPLQSH